MKFTRARSNTDSVQKFYNNKNNSKQWSAENSYKCDFFNFGMQQIQQDTWSDITVKKGFHIYERINQHFDKNDITKCTFSYNIDNFKSAQLGTNTFDWYNGYTDYGFTFITWYIDLTQIFKFT